MYINRIQIENIRSLENVDWDLGDKPQAGWHVIIGDNGAGKTSFLRAISIALLGRNDAEALTLDWQSYLREGAFQSDVEVQVARDESFDAFFGFMPEGNDFYAAFRLEEARTGGISRDFVPAPPKNASDLHKYEMQDAGWFSAAYGPFRRFGGGETAKSEGWESRPDLARHISLFRENVALPQTIEWLRNLNYQKLEGLPEGELLDSVIRFINQEGFLPNGVQLTKVSSAGVEFTDGGGATIGIENLSDGYRSILCMTLELLRQLARAYPDTPLFDEGESVTVRVPGVVLIDEVDVHLHPTWQRSVGLWFRQHFPHIQFIVTSHSPLVCQAASVGTVWRLPAPGTSETGAFVEGIALERLLYGDILDAFSTNLFGEGVSRSEESQRLLERLAFLNVQGLRRDLDAEEREERRRLRGIFSSMSSVMEVAESEGAQR